VAWSSLRRRTSLKSYTHLQSRTGLRRKHNGVPKAIRMQVLARDGYRCRWCGAYGTITSLDAHHIRLRSEGGKDTAANLIAMCGNFCGNRCHARAHDSRRYLAMVARLDTSDDWQSVQPAPWGRDMFGDFGEEDNNNAAAG